MQSTGNGRPEVCAANLLKTVRYEVPYERIKGLPADLIDMPEDEAAATFVEAALWNIETYEPRLGKSAAISMSSVSAGNAEVLIEIGSRTGRI